MKQNAIIKITRRITEDQRNLQDLCGGYDDLNTLTTTTKSLINCSRCCTEQWKQ